MTYNLISQWLMAQNVGREQLVLVSGGLVLVAVLLGCALRLIKTVKLDNLFATPFLKFIYASFLKPHTAKAGDGQQSALESFYSAQVRVVEVPLRMAHSPIAGVCIRCYSQATIMWS